MTRNDCRISQADLPRAAPFFKRQRPAFLRGLQGCRTFRRENRNKNSASARLDQDALRCAAEIAPRITEFGTGDAAAVRPKPGLGVEQHPVSNRIAGEADRKVTIDERPRTKI